MLEDDHLLVLLHAPPKPGQDTREARVFWRAADGTWKASKGKAAKAFPEHMAEYQAAIDALEAEEDAAKTAEQYFSVLERAQPLARACRNMHAALQQARDLLPEDPDVLLARDDAYALERSADLLVLDIRNAFDLYVAKKTEELSQSGHAMAVAGHRLNTLAAIFLPTATLAAVLGMNLQHGMEGLAPPVPFILAIVLGIMMGLGVKTWLDRP